MMMMTAASLPRPVLGFLSGGLHRGDSRLIFARKVRCDPEHTLDEHELAAVVHLMFLYAKQHIEAAAAGRITSGRHGYTLAQEIVGQCFKAGGVFLTVFFEESDDVRLGSRLSGLSHHLASKF